MKKFNKTIALILSVMMIAVCLFACDNGEQSAQSDDPTSASAGPSSSGGGAGTSSSEEDNNGSIEIINPDEGYNEGGEPSASDFAVSVPEYEKTNYVLLDNKATDYVIVVDKNASSTVYNAVTELNYFFNYATGTVFGLTTDDKVNWSTGAKYISIGTNRISKAAGLGLPSLNSRGYTIKTVNKSIFLIGRTDEADAYAVYALLKTMLNYEYYSSDEFVIAKAKTLYLPRLDVSVEPDIEFMQTAWGMVNSTYQTRMTYQGGAIIFPEGSGSWHNSFDYVSPDEYSVTHPKWFATDGENLCLTARGDAAEYNELVALVVGKMKKVIEDNPAGKTVTFTHQDNGTWCTCPACTAIKNKYNGCNSAIKIMFMNDVVDQVEAWREENYPERDDLRYVFFAYTATRTAPVKEVNGKIVAIDSKVQPHDKIGVMYAPIESDFIHGKTAPQNSSQYADMKNWRALVGDNIFYWFYQTYFYNYFLFYNNFESMQDNYQAMKAQGGVWVFDQSQWDNANSTGFQRLKVYLENKLSWDVNADVAKLTDDYFRYYYRDAKGYMKELFVKMRLNLLNMSENLGVGGWIGTRINNSEYYKLNTLLEWNSLINSAYGAIEKYKTTDPALYGKLYDRICLESLAVRFLIIDLYGSQVYTAPELYAEKVAFKADCARLNYTKYSENRLITALWAEWKI